MYAVMHKPRVIARLASFMLMPHIVPQKQPIGCCCQQDAVVKWTLPGMVLMLASYTACAVLMYLGAQLVLGLATIMFWRPRWWAVLGQAALFGMHS